MELFSLGRLNLWREGILIDDGKEIINYGEDNLYPQRAKTATLRSPLVKSGIGLIADFLEGSGFETPIDEPINSHGHTDNDLLKLVSEDLSLYNGFAILVNMDGEGKNKNYFSIPFEWIRYAKTEKDGRIKDVYVSNQWSALGSSVENAQKYPLILPGEALDSLNAPSGAIFYYTGLRQQYPLARMDAIFDTAQADAGVQTFEFSNINNGFLSATIFKHYGGFKSDKERQKFADNVQKFIGAENANSVFVVDIDEELKDAELFEQLPANNNDSLFDSTVRNIINRVLQHLRLPVSLMSVTSDGAVFTQQNISDDVMLMNERTESDRKVIERVFKALEINDSLIIEKELKVNNESDSISQPGGAPPVVANVGEPGENEN